MTEQLDTFSYDPLYIVVSRNGKSFASSPMVVVCCKSCQTVNTFGLGAFARAFRNVLSCAGCGRFFIYHKSYVNSRAKVITPEEYAKEYDKLNTNAWAPNDPKISSEIAELADRLAILEQKYQSLLAALAALAKL